MFERFTEKAIRVIMLAQEEARRLGHNFVGTEQVLLGLIGEGSGVAAKTLKSMGVNIKDARAQVEKIIGRGSGFVAVEIPFTPRAKKVLELSWDEARQLGHNYIGTEHLLLGLIREGEGVAAKVLENLGVDLNKCRSNVIKLLGESRTGQGPQTTTAGAPQSKAKTPSLDEFGTDLTLAAQEQRLDPVVGREKEVERVIQILARRTKNNPILIGEPGVGKTAIAQGLAMKIIDCEVPDILENKKTIIYCKYKDEVQQIYDILNSKYQNCAVKCDGSLSSKKREESLARFASDRSINYMITSKYCTAFGHNLQFCSNVIYYNNDYNYSTKLQSEDRIYRIGQKKETEFINICADYSIDKQIIKSLYKKQNLLDLFRATLDSNQKSSLLQYLQLDDISKQKALTLHQCSDLEEIL